MLKVKEILDSKRRRDEILLVQTADAATKAVDIMVENDTGSVAVYEGDAFIGMLTFREMFQAAKSKGFAAAANTPCGELVAADGQCTTPDDSVDQVRNIMTSQHIRYLPVVDNGKLVGIISFYDVARSVAKAVDFENRMLKEYISDWPQNRE